MCDAHVKKVDKTHKKSSILFKQNTNYCYRFVFPFCFCFLTKPCSMFNVLREIWSKINVFSTKNKTFIKKKGKIRSIFLCTWLNFTHTHEKKWSIKYSLEVKKENIIKMSTQFMSDLCDDNFFVTKSIERQKRDVLMVGSNRKGTLFTHIPSKTFLLWPKAGTRP